MLAPGSSAKTLPLPGADLNGIFTLRNVHDTQKIDAALGNQDGNGTRKKLVIVGSSFIGTEVANAAAKVPLPPLPSTFRMLSLVQRAEVTVIGMEKTPFEKILGAQIGDALRKAQEKNGVKFHLSAQLDSFVPSPSDKNQVGGVKLKSGETVEADVVVLGVGAKPNTELLEKAGVGLEKDGSVMVDEHLRVKEGGGKVFAIGDIATYPDVIGGKNPIRVERASCPTPHLLETRRLNLAPQTGTSPATTPSTSRGSSPRRRRTARTRKRASPDRPSSGRLRASSSATSAAPRPRSGTTCTSSATPRSSSSSPTTSRATRSSPSGPCRCFISFPFFHAWVGADGRVQNDPVVSASAELFANARFPSFKEVRAPETSLQSRL